ncbi:putative leucine-rich repeat receptor-like protein kinase [Heracleum sosnowskyi]|uniref:Leucine-rich repeat receptor-like protein kinase n=1 Tax=Heracleum sosnowskyi TaxID=360622 RepID=A0AAD8GWF9_9APIA|nr:putative leucine-rich repeat receptor-like protein kinase [Heracleum sosnowskyi]
MRIFNKPFVLVLFHNHCNWIGITCNSAGSVSEIIISGRVISGTLAHFNFSSFPNLTSLDMSGINLSDSIPVDIGNATQLQHLSLFANNLNGNIPSSIGLLTELQTLQLDHNNLNSSIPPELGLCTKLNILDLGGNSLTGPLPFSFSNLTQISDLSLWDNCLSGELLPHFISNWTELTSLDMKNNTFTGNIPSEIGLLTNLEYLLSGSIPKDLGKYTPYLSQVDLSKNKLSGEIPITICKAALSLLDLSRYIVFTTLKPWRFVRIIERAEQKLIRRYMKNT